ncbi:MAG: hypothetical protein POG24_08460, partial [Acidocella sp.]|nr:hypothetical protein [Acidocella sp.]
ETALTLIGQASPQAQLAVPQPELENISARMAEALVRQNQLSTSNFNIIPLGQNTMASIILGRWGLRPNRQNITTITPFDFGDFYETSSAQAIETNFNFLSNRANFNTAPVGVGGEIMQHPASGASFFLARRSEWSEIALDGFHQSLSAMVANWQSCSAGSAQIYFHIISQPGHLHGLLSAAQNHLLSNGAHLVIINTLAEPESCGTHANLTYIHAPAPASYNYYHLLHAATAQALAYEREILAPIFSILNQAA